MTSLCRILAIGVSLALCLAPGAGAETALHQPAPAMELLFTAKVQQHSSRIEDAVVPSRGREGGYIGTSDGTAKGRLSGAVHTSFWSGNCLYPALHQGQAPPPELHLCTINPAGFIETADGARIRFDGKGYGLLSPERYAVSMSMAFSTDDPRYQWLTHLLGSMTGEVDAKEGISTWVVYVPRSQTEAGNKDPHGCCKID